MVSSSFSLQSFSLEQVQIAFQMSISKASSHSNLHSKDKMNHLHRCISAPPLAFLGLQTAILRSAEPAHMASWAPCLQEMPGPLVPLIEESKSLECPLCPANLEGLLQRGGQQPPLPLPSWGVPCPGCAWTTMHHLSALLCSQKPLWWAPSPSTQALQMGSLAQERRGHPGRIWLYCPWHHWGQGCCFAACVDL